MYKSKIYIKTGKACTSVQETDNQHFNYYKRAKSCTTDVQQAGLIIKLIY